MGFLLRKGVVWFFLATITEVPPTVGSSGFLAPLLSSHHYFTLQVLISLNLNGSPSICPVRQ